MQSLVLHLPIYFAAATIVSFLSNAGASISWRRAQGLHWTEQARRMYPARVSAMLNVYLVALAVGAHEAFAVHASKFAAIAAGATTLAGGILGCYALDRSIYTALNFRSWCAMVGGSWLLRFAYWGVILAGVVLMPEQFNLEVLWISLGVFGVHIAFLAGAGLKVARWLGLAIEPSSEILRVVEEAAAPAGIKPWTLVLRTPMANALALPHRKGLILTSRLVEEFNSAEIAAVVGHEMGHLTEPRRVVWARILGATAALPIIFIRPIAEQFGPAGVITLICAIWLIMIFIGKMSRRMEVRADAMAVAQTGAGGETYARVLERLYELNLMPAVMSGRRRVHPHLYDRLIAAGVTPNFERPKPPGRIAWTSWLLIAGLFVYLFLSLPK